MEGITIPSTSALFYSLMGGILPALFWLWFWTQEDKLHPEPRGRLLAAFLAGMVAVPIAYPMQSWAYSYLGMGFVTLLIWATAEEILKYLAASTTGLLSRAFDEPIDAMIYLVTAALGFSALENTMFILNPLLDGHLQASFATGNMRFIGASVLHVVSSATLGFFIGREFYRTRLAKIAFRVMGLAVAIALHTVFNLFIIYENGGNTFLVFSFVWIGAIFALLMFEKIKTIKK
ncbi:MAG: PrsW family glutamic-type intramembrane protease [Candidatus Paceibacterota bacterium]|jgi:RsiW-degrading membrane proteinase PrsW (M82 family)